jgi:hypothetical protein
MKLHKILLSSVTAFLLTWLPSVPAMALNADQQALIDAYKAPFAIYLAALQTLGKSLQAAKSDSDVARAADKFCDEANQFVDQFNGIKDRYEGTAVLKSMDSEPEAKKMIDDFMDDLRKKIEQAKPIFDALTSSLDKYPGSAQIRRVRDRIAATFQRIQLLQMSPEALSRPQQDAPAKILAGSFGQGRAVALAKAATKPMFLEKSSVGEPCRYPALVGWLPGPQPLRDSVAGGAQPPRLHDSGSDRPPEQGSASSMFIIAQHRLQPQFDGRRG